MTIKILGGICSYNGQILSVNDVITSTEEHEKRLVALGVAVYVVETPPEKTTKKIPIVDKQKVLLEEMQLNFEPTKAKGLNVDNLVKLAEHFGIEEGKTFNEKGERLTKAEIIKLILNQEADEQEQENGQQEQVNKQPDEVNNQETNNQEQGEGDNQEVNNLDETNQGVELSFTAGE